jgi:succinyl-CoA synthetase beta subunit
MVEPDIEDLAEETRKELEKRDIDVSYVFTPRTISPLSRKLLLTQQ